MTSSGRPDRGDAPLVSVIVPAFNAAATLTATVQSVLAQTHRRLEVFIVDDGSADDTARIARHLALSDPRVRLLQQENGGVARARNAALAVASGSYVAWIDADDLWHPEKIARQIAVFRAAPQPLTFVYTGYRLVDSQDVVLPNYRPLTDVSGLTVCRQIATNFFSNVSSIMVPLALARKAGGHDPKLRDDGVEGAEDLLLQLRLAALGPVGCCRAALVGYRMHGGNMSRGHARAAGSNLRALDLIAEEIPEIPRAVFRLGRARVLGFVPMVLGGGRPAAAVRLALRIAAGQPLRTLEMALRMALAAPRLKATARRSDPAIGRSFHAADPDTAPWSGHMLLPSRQKRWLDACDARFAAGLDDRRPDTASAAPAVPCAAGMT